MGRKPLARLILAVFLPILLLTGCLREENDFIYDMASAPKNLDPQSAADESSRLVIANIFEGLVTVDADGTIQPGAAESWTQSADGLTYTFQLRENGEWSDGTPVTAADFVYGFRRLFDPATNAPGVSDFLCIAGGEAVLAGEADPSSLGVTASGDYELTIRLERYSSRFLELLATAPAMPCNEEFFLETKGKYGLARDKIMGNGAFYLSSWLESGTVRLRPSATYYDRKNVTATSLTLAVPSSETPLKRFSEGTTSAIALSGADFLSLGDVSGQEVLQSDSSVWGMVFRVDQEPFSSLQLRRALFLDGDFSTMETVLPDYYERAQAVISKNVLLNGENYRSLVGENLMPTVDRSAALEAYNAGVKEVSGDSLSGIRLIVPEGYGHEENFAYLSQIWQRDFGLYLKVETLDQDTYQSRLAAGDYECALISLSGSSPSAVLEQFTSENGLYSNTAFDLLVDQAASESSASAAAKLYLQAEQMLIDEALFLPFYYQEEYFVSAPGVSGLSYRFDVRMPDFRFGVIR